MLEVFNGGKVEVILAVLGQEKNVKESFSDLVSDATGEEILDFAEIMASLAPDTHELEYAVGTISTRYLR